MPSLLLLLLLLVCLRTPPATVLATAPGALIGRFFNNPPFWPVAVALDASGDMYVLDREHSAIVVIKPSGVVKRNLTNFGFGLLNGIARNATTHALYVCDTAANTVVQLTSQGRVTATFAGFDQPSGVSLDGDGYFWVADTGHKAVVRIRAERPHHRTTFFGPTGQANFTSPNSIYVAPNTGRVFVSDNTMVVIEMTRSGRHVRNYSGDYFRPQQVVVDDDNSVLYVASSGSIVGFSLSTGRAVSSWGFWSGLVNPYGINYAAGKLYVTDTGNNQVVVVNPITEAYITSYYLPLSQPTAVAVDSTGNIFITDSGNSRVVKLDNGGAQLNVSALSFHNPYGIAVDASDNIYVVNNAANNVVKLRRDFKVTATWTTGDLSAPTYCALNQAGTRLYVSDSGHSAIKVFAVNTGVLVDTITNSHAILSPLGIALDSSNRIYLTNSGYGKIHVLTLSGRSTATYDASYGSDHSNLTGIAVDSAGYIYASDAFNNRVAVLAGGTPQTPIDVKNYDGDPVTNAAGVALDASRNVYVVLSRTNPNGAVYEYSAVDPE